jgi:uncharacterized membrane protein YbhN (UPF0104 family)
VSEPAPVVPASSLLRWLRWIELAGALLVLGFLGSYLARNWSQVASHDWAIDWARLAAASGGTALAYSGLVVLWRHLLSTLGGSLSLVDAHRIWYLSNLGRYVPGKVLQLAGTAYLGRAKNVSPVLSVASMITAQLFVLGTGLIVALLAIPDAASQTRGDLRLAGFAAAGLFLAVLLTPLFGGLHRFALEVVGRGAHYVAVPWRERLMLVAAYGILWIILGGSFHLFLSGVTAVPSGTFWPITGIFAAAYLAGYLAVFVPGGLGVREGALAVLLAIYIPATIAVAAALLTRLWSTAVELVVAAVLISRYGVSDLRAVTEPDPGKAHG